ncbi:putative oxidoreductase C-terminal domain-containing protein [Telluribacter humicola]|uniref:putative oxidoreductase C-terminal domain-containing protein n=1 Tax=Telluribacter humicola TaxID=1720261 RepID=UPI001A967F2B|nr:putative oxidoreductase C-terminal domain-containing protein [Telluribacter humicola]
MKVKKLLPSLLATALVAGQGCQTMKSTESTDQQLGLMVVDPGHFHAALVQKYMYDNMSPVVHVYAPEGPDVKSYLDKIEKYNARPEDPTKWEEKTYTGTDYLEKMLAQKPGNIVVLAGNNQKKTSYIKQAVDAGLHVLADKPMAINAEGFELLKQAFASAEKNNVLLYDIMTERYEITNTLQRELANMPEIFGELQKGTPQEPAVVKESVHHIFKYISGDPIVRPAWFFDVTQQGEGIVDVTTHLVDLVQWASFPETPLDYQKDVQILSARRWPTAMTPSQFKKVTKLNEYPEYLNKDTKDSILQVYSNGEMNYTLKGVHAKVLVKWDFEAPEGTGDTHYSIMRGSKANLIIRQGKEQNYKPVLYIEPVGSDASYEQNLKTAFAKAAEEYPGIELKKTQAGWEITVPQKYDTGHEAHFSQVAQKYMEYLKEGKLPAWEVPNMLTKYYTTTQALKKAANGQQQ